MVRSVDCQEMDANRKLSAVFEGKEDLMGELNHLIREQMSLLPALDGLRVAATAHKERLRARAGIQAGSTSAEGNDVDLVQRDVSLSGEDSRHADWLGRAAIGRAGTQRRAACRSWRTPTACSIGAFLTITHST